MPTTNLSAIVTSLDAATDATQFQRVARAAVEMLPRLRNAGDRESYLRLADAIGAAARRLAAS